MNRTLGFNKEKSGGWYVVLPEWKGSHAELAMVAGADTMLDVLSGGTNNVTLDVSTEKVEGWNRCELINGSNDNPGAGGSYHFYTDKGVLVMSLWLCHVAHFVFGEFPKQFWVRVAE